MPDRPDPLARMRQLAEQANAAPDPRRQTPFGELPETPQERMLRGRIATGITEHRIRCTQHPRIPQPATCPCCAWNTALIRASRVAQGATVPPVDPQTWPPRPPRKEN